MRTVLSQLPEMITFEEEPAAQRRSSYWWGI